MNSSLTILALGFGLGAVPLTAYAQAEAQAEADAVADLSLEALFSQEVTSVARRLQPVEEAAAAVYVIDRQDIERSGETSLPKLLRMAPGTEVAQSDVDSYAVSVRGFNGRFSNKLLVMVDGRDIYVPSLSGVVWGQQLTPSEDLERIEVVRGPGAVMWGANAVNGVINVVTRHAVDTLGTAATARADTEGGVRLFSRHGARVGASGAVRLYTVAHSAPSLDVVNDASDIRQETIQAGFRYDVEPTERDAFTVQGDVQSGGPDSQNTGFLASVGDFEGANLLGRWVRSTPGGSVSVQAYWDRLLREDMNVNVRRDIFDFDFSHGFEVARRHNIVWGLNVRETQDRLDGGPLISFDPRSKDETRLGAYAQDDIALIRERLNASLGVKLEDSGEGVEIQPSLRVIWTDPAKWSLWASLSRAVRTPSRFESDANAGAGVLPANSPENPTSVPLILIETGSDNLDSEVLVAVEAGWRARLTRRLSVDVVAFHNDYEMLITRSPGTITFAQGPLGAYGIIPLTSENAGDATSYGAEASLDFQVHRRWRLEGAATWLEMQMNRLANAADDIGSPEWQVSLRSNFDLSESLDLDVWVRHVAALENAQTPSYTDLDVRLAWRPSARAEVFLRGEDLLEPRRIEYSGIFAGVASGLLERRLEAGLALRF